MKQLMKLSDIVGKSCVVNTGSEEAMDFLDRCFELGYHFGEHTSLASMPIHLRSHICSKYKNGELSFYLGEKMSIEWCRAEWFKENYPYSECPFYTINQFEEFSVINADFHDIGDLLTVNVKEG